MNSAGSERDRLVLAPFYGVLLLAGYLAFRIVAPFLAPLAYCLAGDHGPRRSRRAVVAGV
jgi:hypothetical protein